MSDINLYPEMNQTIKDLLGMSTEPMNQYILARIEQLEQENEQLRAIPTCEIPATENEPLTLDELRGMDGEPVWIECLINSDLNCWGYHDEDGINGYCAFFHDDEYGTGWLAYRRKPEGGVKGVVRKCKHENKNGTCSLKGCYAHRHKCYTEDMCKCFDPITNADRIRSMSDEELAQWMLDNAAFNCEANCTSHDPMGKYLGSKCDEDCLAHCLEWLRAESEATT